MSKYFNTNGCCDPGRHYMINLSARLYEVKQMIDDGQYFSINRARQYGKTTLIHGLVDFLRNDYEVLSLDFQTLSFEDFKSESYFAAAFSRELLEASDHIPDSVRENLERFSEEPDPAITLSILFKTLIQWCELSERKIVLIIDEVDSATNNQVFLDFLSQLRAYYLKRDRTTTFQSVILAGVYDVKNIRRKIRPDEEHRTNSPWNIAADFLVDMSFSVSEIAGMLQEYEDDHHTGMDISLMSELLYASTSGYPYLVSRLCKLIDERVSGTKEFPDKTGAWTKAGYLEAEKQLLTERNTLFESLVNKLTDYPQLRTVLYELLFTGKTIPYNPLNQYIDTAEMFGFVKNNNGNAVVANRIFESVLYNLFLSQEYMQSREYDAGLQEKNQFIVKGHLNMKKVLEKFVEHFTSLYGDREETFLEEDGRRYFMLYIKPIINGTGNCYVEPETRNRERMDLVIDYRGEQFVIELKIWRGNAYNTRGEKQLSGYLNYFHLQKGYMLSFNFNKTKQIGLKEITVGNKLLIEAVV